MPRLIPILLLVLFQFSCTDVYVRRQRQGVLLRNIPPKALVYIDGRLMGVGAAVNGRPLSLSKGKHRLAVVESGFHSHFSTFTLYGGDLLKRRVRMYRRLDE